MKKKLILGVLVTLCLTGCNSEPQEPIESKIPNIVIEDEVVEQKQEELLPSVVEIDCTEPYECLEKSDIYGCIDESISCDLISVVENYITNELQDKNFHNVILLNIWYNPIDKETHFELLFDSNNFRQIAIHDDLQSCDVIYESHLSDYRLQQLGY